MTDLLDWIIRKVFEPFTRRLPDVEVENVEWIEDDRVEITTRRGDRTATNTCLVFDREEVDRFRKIDTG